MIESAVLAASAHPAPAAEPVAGWRGRAGAALLVVGALAVVLAWVPSELFDLERYLVPKSLVLHLVALGLLLLGLAPTTRGAWGRTGLLLALFVAWSAASALLATNRWLALAAWGVSFSSAVVFLTARALPRGLRWPALAGILTAVVVAAALGVAQAYGYQSSWLSDSRPPGGTFGNRNFLGHLAAIAAPALLMTALRARRGGGAALALLGLGVLAALIVLTRSRAAWLGGIGGVAAAVVALVFAARRGGAPLRSGRLLAGGVVAAAAIAVAVLVPNDLDWVADAPYAATLGRIADYSEGSGRGRLIQYRNSLALVPRNPIFGSGPGNWFVDYPLVTTDGDPAYAGAEAIPTNPWPSSDWVATLAERGAIGTLLLLAAGGAALAAALRRREDGHGAEGASESPFAAGAVAGVLCAVFVCGSFDAVLLLPAPALVTWASLGLMLPRPSARGASWGPGASLWLRRGALTAAAVLALATAAHTTAIALTASSRQTAALARAARLAPGEHRLRLTLARRGGRCDDARAAARLMPNHQRVTRLAARCG